MFDLWLQCVFWTSDVCVMNVRMVGQMQNAHVHVLFVYASLGVDGCMLMDVDGWIPKTVHQTAMGVGGWTLICCMCIEMCIQICICVTGCRWLDVDGWTSNCDGCHR